MEHPAQQRLLSLQNVQQATSLGRSTIYAAINGTGGLPLFPGPIHIGRKSVWLEHEVQTWIADRIAEAKLGAA
jgi:predicted DNA-binding transcriptional regulator AlpA